MNKNAKLYEFPVSATKKDSDLKIIAERIGVINEMAEEGRISERLRLRLIKAILK